MLFVDNPVGTGFSYTDRPDAYATNVSTVASDMLVLLKHFFSEKPEFQVCPLLHFLFFIFLPVCQKDGLIKRCLNTKVTPKHISIKGAKVYCSVLFRASPSTFSLSHMEGRWQLLSP